MTFGEKLKICRKAFDITQEELANKLGTSKQVISRYESETRVPKITVAQKYADALNVPVSVLINPDITLCVWEHASHVEDYFNSNDKERLYLVQKMGLDPRVADDYSQIQGSAIITPENLSSEDYHLIELFHRASPSDQDTIRYILKRYEDSESVVSREIS